MVLVGVAQWISPLGAPPLYDGVTTVAPYLWLLPPAGAAGGAQGATGTSGVAAGTNRLIAIATPELQPQAQLFATPGAFVLPAGTTSIKLSIEPVLPQALPTDGHIEGNVYRISVDNQAGVPLVAPASAEVTVGLRGPYTTPNQVIAVDDGTGWHKLKTDDAGFAASYLAVVTGGGDYAMVAPGPGGPYPTATPVGGASGGSSGRPRGPGRHRAARPPGHRWASSRASGRSAGAPPRAPARPRRAIRRAGGRRSRRSQSWWSWPWPSSPSSPGAAGDADRRRANRPAIRARIVVRPSPGQAGSGAKIRPSSKAGVSTSWS